MRRFFIPPGHSNRATAVLDGTDAHHIATVLRLGPGDRIALFDGEGFASEAVIERVDPGRVRVRLLLNTPDTLRESPISLTVAQGFLKERKMDSLVRQLTELGIDRWVPFIAERSVARPDARRMDSRLKRWETIAREAVKQCRRHRIPQIDRLHAFDEMLQLGEAHDTRLIFWENETQCPKAPAAETADRPRAILIVLGPEGGLTEREIGLAATRGFTTAALGPRILRAETATLAACVIVQHLFGDMG